MLFKAFTVLALTMSVLAHPYRGKHRHPLKPSGSGLVVSPTGGKYGMGNSTWGYGPSGTGFATGTSIAPTGVAPESSVETLVLPTCISAGYSLGTVVAVASDPPVGLPLCSTGSQSTTTLYSTELVTSTVTAEDTTTVVLSSISASDVISSSGSPDLSPTRVDNEAASSSTATSPTATSAETSTVTVASVSPAETPTPTPTSLSSSTLSISLEVAPTTPASASPTSESPPPSAEEIYSSGVMNAPGGFYEASAAVSDPVYPSEPPTGSYGAGKRGLAYNSAALTNAFAGTSMSWAYNWAPIPDGVLDSAIEFVPMLWGPKTLSGWETGLKSSLAAGAKHILSFNEPDLDAQANMDSATAAAAHIKYVNPYAGQARIGSPAITNGGPSGGTDGMGLGWLQNFFQKCGGNCKVDFVAFHWYDSADNVAYFKKHVQDVIVLAKANGVPKVWLTEFAASGSDEQVAKFLAEVLPWMDSNDAIERYAYFMCSEGELVSGNSLSAVGKAYAA